MIFAKMVSAIGFSCSETERRVRFMFKF
jgi:hypothetical protein